MDSWLISLSILSYKRFMKGSDIPVFHITDGVFETKHNMVWGFKRYG